MKTILNLIVMLCLLFYEISSYADEPEAINDTTGIVYTNLQTAINEATASDIIKIKGKFVGSFSIGQSLTLKGREGAILDGNHAGTVLNITLNGSIQVTLEHLTIQNGFSSTTGGGINNIAILVLQHVKMIKNKALLDGGAIANAIIGNNMLGMGEVTVIKSHLRKNKSGQNGGAIFSNGGNVTVQSSSVKFNKASSNGGAIYSNQCRTIITDSHVNFNNATNNGGALYNNNNSTTNLTKTKLEYNKATSGGGIFNSASKITIYGSKLHNNTANAQGGGLFNNSSATALFQFSTVSDNNAQNGGGIFNMAGGKFTLIETELEDNTPNNIAQ